MPELLHFSTLVEYCHGVNISPPKSDLYDIRTFEENMVSVRHQMPHFKHEFYAIALKIDGGGFATTGNYDTKDRLATIFFNSPYQIIHWDIVPDWKGYYVIFSEDFFRRLKPDAKITRQFPFFLSDYTIPLTVTPDDISIFERVFEHIYREHQTGGKLHQEIIVDLVHILLLKTKRLYDEQQAGVEISTHQRDGDINLVSRFKSLIETSFYSNQYYEDQTPHQVQFYAEKLAIHPNHLNAVVKRISGKSALELIQQHVLSSAKSKLRNTGLSIKEVAFQLHYQYPNHFSSFFKKKTGMSPGDFRSK
ncbi:MAG: helix-turn-helix domain-containing protein [Balneolales bacterium]|nr:helix-turn-helix domain-containing protein [Balneolales bacterium]